MQHPRQFWLQIQALRLPLFMTIVAALLFMVPPQTNEIYRALAQISATTDWNKPEKYRGLVMEFSLGVSGIITLSIFLWISARRAASIFQMDTATGKSVGVKEDFIFRPWILLWMPRLLILVVPACAAAGILLSDVQPGFEEKVKDAMASVFKLQFMHDGLSERFATKFAARTATKLLLFSSYLTYMAALLITIGGAVFFAIVLIDKPRLAIFFARPNWWSTYVAGPATLGLLGGAIWVSITYPVAIPQMLGSIFIMSLFLVVLLLVLLELQRWHQKTGIPIIGILIGCALLFSVFDWNDNHSIRSLPASGESAPRDAGFAKAFKRWMSSRADTDKYTDKAYPIYIVAAQGGGIYAATHAATFMGELQDLCPGFAHHLFAISGVSGGSVGAATFAALTKDIDWTQKSDKEKFGCVTDINAERTTLFADATTSIFARDLWSPLSAGLMFPDFLQRFLFFPVHAWDRGRTLEFALEDAYDEAIRESRFLPEGTPSKRPLSKPFLAHWNPETNSHTPALVMNMTDVSSGKRRVAAPFSFRGIELSFLPLWATKEENNSIQPDLNPPVSTTAGLSARFPWVTPTAHFYEKQKAGITGENIKRKVRVVDGGYFENSGVVSALDLIKQIIATVSDAKIKQKIEINLLVFTSAEFDAGGSYGLGEMMDPIRTMFSTRSARAGIAVGEALESLERLSTSTPHINADVIRLELNGYGYPLPLGWRLSPVTRHLISYHNGSERFCSDKELSSSTSRLAANTASCAKRQIYDRLR